MINVCQPFNVGSLIAQNVSWDHSNKTEHRALGGYSICISRRLGCLYEEIL